MPALSEQTIIITGAAQGLGAGIAKVFAERGARLVLMDNKADELAAFNAQIGGTAQCITVDLADPKALS
jgi:NADP-dependent 3-hydroxy acid dehydrogenase YdfG